MVFRSNRQQGIRKTCELHGQDLSTRSSSPGPSRFSRAASDKPGGRQERTEDTPGFTLPE